MVTMVSMRQTILRILHTMPIYRPIHILIFPCYTLLFGRIPPVPNFAKIHARGPRGRLRIAPRDLIPPPRCACVRRAGHTPVVTTSAIQHSTHIATRTFDRPAVTRHTTRQQPEHRVTPTALGFSSHTACSSLLPTRAAVLRTFGSSWRFAALTRNSPTKHHKPTWPQICPNPAKPNGSKPS